MTNAGAHPDVLLEGYLTTQDPDTDEWVQGWFHLKDDTMFFFPSPTAQEPTMLVSFDHRSEVRHMTKEQAPAAPNRLHFFFSLKEKEGAVVVFSAPTEEEREHWVDSLGDCIANLIIPILRKKSPYTWIPYEVGLWAEMVGFGEYKQALVDGDVTGKVLLSLSKMDLKGYGIMKLGHRLRFLKCIEQLKYDAEHHTDGSYEDSLSSVESWKSIGDLDAELVVKCFCGKGNDQVIKLIRISEKESLSELKKKLREEFKFKFSLRYRDKDGDKVSLKKQSDYDDALRLVTQNTLKLYLTKLK